MITTATQQVRNLVTKSLSKVPMYATLHSAEPVINDPTATQLLMSGAPAVRVVMATNGAEMWNSAKVTFAGIQPGQIATHLALCATPTGQEILFYGEIPALGVSSPLWDFYDVEPEAIRIAVI